MKRAEELSSSDGYFYDCTTRPTSIQPYGDIGGIGVVLSFLITAWMVVALLMGYYITVYSPLLDPLRPKDDQIREVEEPNQVDVAVLGFFRQWKWLDWKRRANKRSRLEKTLNKCVLTCLDTQIITGIAVLVSGFALLRSGLSAYHWQLITQFAWFSSITHLTGLSFLRNYLSNRKGERRWRATAMFVMLCFLFVAVWMTGHFAWVDKSDLREMENNDAQPHDYAICALSSGFDTSTSSYESMVLTIVLLIYGYAIRVAKMRKGFSLGLRQFTTFFLKESCSIEIQWHQAFEGSISIGFKTAVLRPIYIAGLRVLYIHIEILTSFLAEVFWLALSVAWGTKKLVKTRYHGPGDENTWTFGQILSVALLAAPLLAFVEHFTEARGPKERRRPEFMMSELAGASVNDTTEAATSSLVTSFQKSYDFYGLVAVTLFSYAIYIDFFLVNNPLGIASALASTALTTFFLNPFLQMYWVLATLWLTKLKVDSIVIINIKLLIFLSILTTSSQGYLQPYFATFETVTELGIELKSTIAMEGHLILMILSVYIILILREIVRRRFDICVNLSRSAITKGLTILAGLLIFAIPWIYMILFEQFYYETVLRGPWAIYFSCYLAVFSLLLGVWLSIESMFQGSQAWRRFRKIARVLVLAVIMIAVWFVSYIQWFGSDILLNRVERIMDLELINFAPTLLSALIMVAGIWMISWSFAEAIKACIIRRRMNSLQGPLTG